VTGGTDRAFGFVFAGANLLVGCWSVWKLDEPWWGTFWAAGLFALIALVLPSMLAPLNVAWTALGRAMHSVMNPLILGILFFLMFTPMGLFMRLVGKRPLASRRDEGTSYWVLRDPPGPEPQSLRHPY